MSYNGHTKCAYTGPHMFKHLYDYGVTCMSVLHLRAYSSTQYTTQHCMNGEADNSSFCEHVCI